MNKGTVNLLEAKLKKMLNHLDQTKAKQKKPITQSGTGNIIRRRAGEKEKRFSNKADDIDELRQLDMNKKIKHKRIQLSN